MRSISLLSKTRFSVQTATGLSFNMTRGGANATNGSVAALVRLEVRGPGFLYLGYAQLEHTRPGNYSYRSIGPLAMTVWRGNRRESPSGERRGQREDPPHVLQGGARHARRWESPLQRKKKAFCNLESCQAQTFKTSWRQDQKGIRAHTSSGGAYCAASVRSWTDAVCSAFLSPQRAVSESPHPDDQHLAEFGEVQLQGNTRDSK